MTAELELLQGWVSPALRAEFPELALAQTLVEAGSGRSPREVRERLRRLSDRYTGGKAVTLRQEPIPWAYRVFFRQVGIDPDDHRTPPEEAALERMKHGGFKSRNLLDDALLISTVETGVALIAFDADRVELGSASEPGVGLRLAEPRERLGGDGRPLSARQIVLADRSRSLAVLFSDIAEDRGVHPGTRRMLIAALQVKGVPAVSVEEALWIVADTLRLGQAGAG